MSAPTPPLSTTAEYFRPIDVVFVPPRRRYRHWIHLLLLIATIFTTLVVGARLQLNFFHQWPAFFIPDDGSPFPLRWALAGSHLLMGAPFCISLMLVLLSHEMGHYLCARRYGVQATLPFFIPFPSLIGTLGAFIRIKSPIRSRAALFDIGIAGPIAGFIVAVPVLFIGLALSKALPPDAPPSDIQPGFPLIFHLLRTILVHIGLAPDLAGLPTGSICLHPIAIAGWAGMFATALNLLPGGQLDGGHIVFALAPRGHRWVSWVTILALIPLGFRFWIGWVVWAILLRLSGTRHPDVATEPGLGRQRIWLAVCGLVMLFLTVTPTPIVHSSLTELFHQFRGAD